jgi:hypothetical protein
LFKFVIHEHVSHHLNFKLNPFHHGFTKSQSTITNLASYPDLIIPSVSSQRQTEAICFYLSSSFYIVSHTLLLHKLSAFLYSGSDVNWLRKYLTSQQSQVCVSGILSPPFKQTLTFFRYLLPHRCFSLFINDLCDSVIYSRHPFFMMISEYSVPLNLLKYIIDYISTLIISKAKEMPYSIKTSILTG